MAKTIWQKDLKIIFIFALILRLILAPLFYHPDIKTQNFHFQFLSLGIPNIYQYLGDNRRKLPYQDTFNYPPLTYLSFGVEQIVLKPILPADFTQWLNDWGPNQNNYPNLFYYMLVLKIPYIFFDLGIGYLLYKLYDKKILTIWLFNPFSLYLIYILANFDIVPVFFSVLAFYYLKKSRSNLSFLFLGIATALKLYSLLFFPFFIFYHQTNFKKIFINGLIFSLPLIISVFPFIFNPSFLQALSGSGLTQKIIEFRLLNIPIYPLIYLIVFIFYFFSKNKNLEKSFLFLFLAFFVFVSFHPQWLLWFLPFIIYPVTKNRKTLILFIFFIITTLLYVLLINDRYLLWGHFIPINPFFIQLNHPYLIITQRSRMVPGNIQNYLKYFMAIISFLFLIPSHEKNP